MLRRLNGIRIEENINILTKSVSGRVVPVPKAIKSLTKYNYNLNWLMELYTYYNFFMIRN